MEPDKTNSIWLVRENPKILLHAMRLANSYTSLRLPGVVRHQLKIHVLQVGAGDDASRITERNNKVGEGGTSKVMIPPHLRRVCFLQVQNLKKVVFIQH